MGAGKIFLLTGEIESGKTTLCLNLAQIANQKGIDLGGVASPAVFDKGKKIAIDVLDLRSGSRQRLADLLDGEGSGLVTRRWSFNSSSVAWGNQVLVDAVPCDLLIIDELGPLEFERDSGWIAGFNALERGEFQVAIVVVRPSLVSSAKGRLNISREINLSSPEFGAIDAKDFFSLIGFQGTKEG